MSFGPVDPDLDLVALEERVLARWRERDVIGRGPPAPQGRRAVDLLRGPARPPTAGPGLHHVWARVFKDLYPRFQTMRGQQRAPQGRLGLPRPARSSSRSRRSSGCTPSTRSRPTASTSSTSAAASRCSATSRTGRRSPPRSGTWIDTADAYWTLSQRLRRVGVVAAPPALGQGPALRGPPGHAPTAPAAAPPCRRHELGQPDVYRDVVDPSVYVRFPLTDGPARRRRPARVDHHAVDAHLQRGRRRRARHRLRAGAGRGRRRDRSRPGRGGRAALPEGAEVVERWTGRDLVGLALPAALRPARRRPTGDRAWRVVAADFVSTDDGSGIVHLAPAFGEDDAAGRPGRGPAGAQPGRRRRRLRPHACPPWTGPVRQGRRPPTSSTTSRARGLLVREQPYEHSYPHCWRCGTPLIYWAKTSWFVRTSEQREPSCSRENETHQLAPRHIKHGRFGKWLENNVDWALSRDRYWGTPAADLALRRLRPRHVHRLGGRAGRRSPAATCPSSTCTGPTSTTSRSRAPSCDGHGPAGRRRCSTPGSTRARCRRPSTTTRSRTPTPSSDAFPADFICEAIDQTRGWFYSLLAVNTLVFDAHAVPQRRVPRPHRRRERPEDVEVAGQRHRPVGHLRHPGRRRPALVLLLAGPAVDHPAGAPRTASARRPARRCSRCGTSSPSSPPTPTSTAGRPTARDGAARRPTCSTAGCWASSTTRSPRSPTRSRASTRSAAPPAWPLRRRPVELVRAPLRPRFWKSSDPAAHATLHECLVTTAQLLAPFCPFLADEIYTTLTGEASVHLSDWPEPGGRHDADAGRRRWPRPRRLVALGRAARTDAKVKVRQPLRPGPAAAPGRRRSTPSVDGRDRAPSSTSRRSRTSTRCRAS